MSMKKKNYDEININIYSIYYLLIYGINVHVMAITKMTISVQMPVVGQYTGLTAFTVRVPVGVSLYVSNTMETVHC